MLVELLAYARLDCGSDGLQHVLILELMAGGTLHDYLKRAGGAAGSSRQLWTLLTDTATALAWLHGHATLHRDVKASNVLLDASHSRAKLGDFGLATTHYGELSQTPAVGTWRYLAPEASRHAGGGGRRSSMWHTPASDVYSFGLLLFEATSSVHLLHAMSKKNAFFLRKTLFSPSRLSSPLALRITRTSVG